MAAAAAAVASAQAQQAAVSQTVASSANAVGSTTAIGGLGHPSSFLSPHPFFQKQHPSLSSPFVFPSGKQIHTLNTLMHKKPCNVTTNFLFQILSNYRFVAILLLFCRFFKAMSAAQGKNSIFWSSVGWTWKKVWSTTIFIHTRKDWISNDIKFIWDAGILTYPIVMCAIEKGNFIIKKKQISIL